MYKITFFTTYTDSFYAKDIDYCFNILGKLNNLQSIKVEYVYKNLGMYWKADECLLTCDSENIITYKTLNQMSNDWFKNGKTK